MHPDTHSEPFQLALATVAGAALATYPDDKARVARAVTLVTNGHVTFPAGAEHAEVRSGTDAGLVYHPNGGCQCAGAGWGVERCSHRWAVTLFKRACQQLRTMYFAEYCGSHGIAMLTNDGYIFHGANGETCEVPNLPHRQEWLVLLGRCAIVDTTEDLVGNCFNHDRLMARGRF